MSSPVSERVCVRKITIYVHCQTFAEVSISCEMSEVTVVSATQTFSENLEVITEKEEFNIELRKLYSGRKNDCTKPEWTLERINYVKTTIEKFNSANLQNQPKTQQEYRFAKKYDVMNVGAEKLLILKRTNQMSPLVQIVPSEDYYDRLLQAHISTGHGGRDKIIHALKDKYYIPVPAIKLFVRLCKTCLSKKSCPKSGIVVKPIISQDFNRRGQVDLIDLQSTPSNNYKWLLNYQDHLTKFCFLRPLTSKRAVEVAVELLKIFLEVGAPMILQSDNGKEFTAKIIKELVELWPTCKIINGRPRHPQSQGSIERCNQDVENMLRAWMSDNSSTEWSIGCYFVQFQKNSSHHRTIGRSPYRALFGHDPVTGLSSTHLPASMLAKVEHEEELEQILEEKVELDVQQQEEIQYILKEQQETNESMLIEQEEVDVQQQKVLKNMFTIDKQNYPTDSIEIQLVNDDALVEKHKNVIDPNKKIIVLEDIMMISDYVLEEETKCHICQEIVTGSLRCNNCKHLIHANCGVSTLEEASCSSNLTCNLCWRTVSIEKERTLSLMNLKRAAQDMSKTSSKKFKEINVGATVLVDVPKFDRAPLDSKNITGRVIDKRNDLYRIGTAVGIIKDWLPRNAVQPSPGPKFEDKVPEIILPIRGIASKMSPFDGQGFKQCNCKKSNVQCTTKKCACKKHRVLCNSRCHSSLNCCNK